MSELVPYTEPRFCPSLRQPPPDRRYGGDTSKVVAVPNLDDLRFIQKLEDDPRYRRSTQAIPNKSAQVPLIPSPHHQV